MSKEKQIEEMAKDICQLPRTCDECEVGRINGYICQAKKYAERAYNTGYRKQSEGKWEIVKGSNGKEIMVCTNCRHSQDLHSTFTYCPNCGARMKGV